MPLRSRTWSGIFLSIVLFTYSRPELPYIYIYIHVCVCVCVFVYVCMYVCMYVSEMLAQPQACCCGVDFSHQNQAHVFFSLALGLELRYFPHYLDSRPPKSFAR